MLCLQTKVPLLLTHHITPSDLIYGRDLRRPLELLADCWDTEENDECV